jgi:hypothetical protein
MIRLFNGAGFIDPMAGFTQAAQHQRTQYSVVFNQQDSHREQASA